MSWLFLVTLGTQIIILLVGFGWFMSAWEEEARDTVGIEGEAYCILVVLIYLLFQHGHPVRLICRALSNEDALRCHLFSL